MRSPPAAFRHRYMNWNAATYLLTVHTTSYFFLRGSPCGQGEGRVLYDPPREAPSQVSLMGAMTHIPYGGAPGHLRCVIRLALLSGRVCLFVGSIPGPPIDFVGSVRLAIIINLCE